MNYAEMTQKDRREELEMAQMELSRAMRRVREVQEAIKKYDNPAINDKTTNPAPAT